MRGSSWPSGVRASTKRRPRSAGVRRHPADDPSALRNQTWSPAARVQVEVLFDSGVGSRGQRPWAARAFPDDNRCFAATPPTPVSAPDRGKTASRRTRLRPRESNSGRRRLTESSGYWTKAARVEGERAPSSLRALVGLESPPMDALAKTLGTPAPPTKPAARRSSPITAGGKAYSRRSCDPGAGRTPAPSPPTTPLLARHYGGSSSRGPGEPGNATSSFTNAPEMLNFWLNWERIQIAMRHNMSGFTKNGGHEDVAP